MTAFKVGDRVRLTAFAFGSLTGHVGTEGVVKEVDNDCPTFTYLVDFDEGGSLTTTKGWWVAAEEIEAAPQVPQGAILISPPGAVIVTDTFGAIINRTETFLSFRTVSDGTPYLFIPTAALVGIVADWFHRREGQRFIQAEDLSHSIILSGEVVWVFWANPDRVAEFEVPADVFEALCDGFEIALEKLAMIEALGVVA